MSLVGPRPATRPGGASSVQVKRSEEPECPAPRYPAALELTLSHPGRRLPGGNSLTRQPDR
jgi:hypothetical protein